MGATRTAHRGGQAVPQALDGVRSGGCCRACAAAIIRGKSRMSSTLTYGSVRGVPGDRHPYRDPGFFLLNFLASVILCER